MAPTIVDLDSFAHQVLATSQSSSGFIGTYDNLNNSGAWSFDTSNVRLGGFHAASLKVIEDGVTAANVGRVISTSVFVSSFYVRFTAAPSGSSVFFYLTGPANTPRLSVDTSGHFTVRFVTGTPQTTAATYADSNWHRIDTHIDTSGATYTLDWWVDGTKQTQATLGSQTPTAMAAWRYGTPVNADTLTIWFQDHAMSFTGSDAPLGDHRCGWLLPTSEGTDVLGTTNSIRDEAAGTTNLYTHVDEWPPNTTDYVTYGSTTLGDAASNYAEFIMGTPSDAYVWKLQGIVAGFASATGADTADTQVLDSGLALVDHVGNLLDYSGSTTVLGYFHQVLAGSPTLATATGLRVRWGFSTDTNGIPRLSAVGIEYAGTSQSHVAHASDALVLKTTTAVHAADATLSAFGLTKTHGTDAAIYVSGSALSANLTTGTSVVSASPYATNAFEVLAGQYVLVSFVSRGSTPRNLTAVTDYFDTHLTWSTPVNGTTSNSRKLSYAWAYNDTGVTQRGGLSLTTSGGSSTNVAWSVDEIVGLLAQAPVQSVDVVGATSPATATLAAYQGIRSVVAFLVQEAGNNTASMSGFSFLGAGTNGVRASAVDDLWVAYSNTIRPTTTPSLSFGSNAWGAFGLELAPATNAREHATDSYLVGAGLVQAHSTDAQVASPAPAGNVNLTNGTSVVTTGPYVSGVVAAEPGAYILVSFVSRGSTPRDLSTIVGLGLTWSSPVVLTVDTNLKISYTYAYNDTGATVYGSLTFTTPGGSSVGVDWSADKFVGRKNAAPAQSISGTGSAGPAVVTMSAYQSLSFAVFLVAQKTNKTATMSGFTFLGAGANGIRVSTSTDHWIAYDDTSPTTALNMGISNSAASWGAYGLELLGLDAHHATDSYVAGTPIVLHSTDAALEQTAAQVHAADAYVLRGASHLTDAQIKVLTPTFTGKLSSPSSLLARIELGTIAVFFTEVLSTNQSVDALVMKTLTNTHATDALLAAAQRLVAHSTDAAIDTSGRDLDTQPNLLDFRSLSATEQL